MRHELLKYVVQPVLIERNEDGLIIGERIGEPFAAYSRSSVLEFLDQVERELLSQIPGANGVVSSERIAR